MHLLRFSTLLALSLLLLLAGCNRSPSPPRETVGLSQPEESTPDLQLPESEREYIWSLEHFGNLLAKKGFAQIRDALHDGDPEGVHSVLSTDFQASVPGHDDAIRLSVKRGGVSAARQSRKELSGSISADGFVKLLLEHTAGFGHSLTGKLGIKKIGPVSRGETDGDWQSLATMTFTGSDQGRTGSVTFLVELTFLKPSSETFRTGHWLKGCNVIQVSLASAETPVFEEASDSFGISTAGLHDNWAASEQLMNTGGVFACDYNNDLYTDLLVTDFNSRASAFYEGAPNGRFRNVTREVGLENMWKHFGSGTSAAFVDVNNDGWVDLLFDRGGIWENVKGQKFVNCNDVSNLWEVVQDGAPENSGAVTVADYNCDGLVDVYFHSLAERPNSWLEETGKSTSHNRLLRNTGDWQFEDVTDEAGVAAKGLSAFTSVWFDANGDRWPDLYVTHEFGDGILYLNEDGRRFSPVDISNNSLDFGTMGAASGDFNNDGNIDLYLASMYSKAGSRIIGNMGEDSYSKGVMRRLESLVTGSELYRNSGESKFEAVGHELQVYDIGWAYGPTLEDFDNDGLLDIFAPCGFISRDRNKPDG